MRLVLVSLIALFTSLVLFIGGNVVLGTLISLRLDLEGVSENLLGIVLAFYSLGFIVGATFCVSIIREVGHIRAFAAFAAIACAATLLHPIWVTPESWALMRFLVGFSIAGLLTVTESWINDRATNETRGTILGFYTIVLYIASALGQVLVGLGDPMGYAMFSLVAILLVLSLVPLALTRSLIPTAPTPTEFLGTKRLLSQAPAGVTGVFLAGVALGGFVSLGPIYALRIGLEVGMLSIYMGVSVACAIVLQWPAGWLSDRIGRIPVLVTLLTLGAVAATGVASFSSQSIWLMFALSGAFYAFSSSMYPVGIALANDQLPNDQLVAASAALLRIYGVGTMLGPLLGAYFMGVFDESALFLFIAATMLIGSVAVQFIFREGDEVPLEDQVEFAVVSPASSPVIVELDPRNEEYEEHATGEPAEWDLADKMEMLVIDAEAVIEDSSDEDELEEQEPSATPESDNIEAKSDAATEKKPEIEVEFDEEGIPIVKLYRDEDEDEES